MQREFNKDEIIEIINKPFNYVQDDGRYIKHYNGIAVIYDSSKCEIVSVIDRKPKKEWKKIDDNR